MTGAVPMAPMPDAAPHWIDCDAALAEACARWMRADVLALDTEFIRRQTFYPVPALLQFYDGECVTIIDPLPIRRWAPLAEVLGAPGVIKVLHAGSEDGEVFWRLLGVVPAPLFDTQIAAGLCGMRPGMGYDKLVQSICGQSVPKDQTQSDWLARPLSSRQIRYAAADVYYLYLAYRQLADTAGRLGRLDWILQDGALASRGLATMADPALSYLRLKGIDRMAGPALVVARELCEWREHKARADDRPRGWILKDATVCALAQRRPRTLPALTGIEQLMPSTIRRQGPALLAVIERALARPEQDWPPPPGRVATPEARALLKALRGAVGKLGQDLDVAAELLLSRRQASDVVAAWATTSELAVPEPCSPWRAASLAPILESLSHRAAGQ